MFEINTTEALEWALQRLRWNNASLRNFLFSQARVTSDPSPLFRRTPPFGSPPERMKRQHDAVDKDADTALQSHPLQLLRSFAASSSLASAQNQDVLHNLEAMDPSSQPPSGHHRSASFSYGRPLPSPLQASQAALTLPSPSSLNLPIPLNLPSTSSPLPLAQNAAQAAHMQDLQHQVSVKTLAIQTLQREYDSLLQKLERQRIKSQTLEKKFEVSDAEINSLTDEKERLASQVQALEIQVEELQQARDQARNMGADSAAQYMKIVEMAGRLQGKGVDDKRNWEKERGLLLRRISELESEAPHLPGPIDMGHSSGRESSQLSHSSTTAYSSLGAGPSANPTFSGPEDERAALKREVHAVNRRIFALEQALKTTQEESKAVREAALTLAATSQRIESAAVTALGRTKAGEHRYESGT